MTADFSSGAPEQARLSSDALSTAERMRSGGNSEEIVLPVSEGSEVSPPKAPTRPREQEPANEEDVFKGIVFIRGA
jgi:hypothetical protein